MMRSILNLITIIAFICQSILPVQNVFAQTLTVLPPAGTMIKATADFEPASIRGLVINSENPLKMDFILDTGSSGLEGQTLSKESEKLVKYFLSSLTIPEDQIWVNLSPYEKDRIVPEALGRTEMGRGLLEQDYLLKQLTASLMYPEDELGKKFWERVYEKSMEMYGTTDIPLDTYNKIWIIPDAARINEHQGVAFLVERRMKVMLEEDFVALAKSKGFDQYGVDARESSQSQDSGKVQSDIVRNILIPEIEKEVNEGKTFANLRQIYDALVLATWYKTRLKESFLGQIYADKNKLSGIDNNDSAANEAIWKQYVQSFQKGAYDLVKEEYDPVKQDLVTRKYFSGGFAVVSNDGMLSKLIQNTVFTVALSLALIPGVLARNMRIISVDFQPTVENVKDWKKEDYAYQAPKIAGYLKPSLPDTVPIPPVIKSAADSLFQRFQSNGVYVKNEEVNNYTFFQNVLKAHAQGFVDDSLASGILNGVQFDNDSSNIILSYRDDQGEEVSDTLSFQQSAEVAASDGGKSYLLENFEKPNGFAVFSSGRAFEFPHGLRLIILGYRDESGRERFIIRKMPPYMIYKRGGDLSAGVKTSRSAIFAQQNFLQGSTFIDKLDPSISMESMKGPNGRKLNDTRSTSQRVREFPNEAFNILTVMSMASSGNLLKARNDFPAWLNQSYLITDPRNPIDLTSFTIQKLPSGIRQYYYQDKLLLEVSGETGPSLMGKFTDNIEFHLFVDELGMDQYIFEIKGEKGVFLARPIYRNNDKNMFNFEGYAISLLSADDFKAFSGVKRRQVKPIEILSLGSGNLSPMNVKGLMDIRLTEQDLEIMRNTAHVKLDAYVEFETRVIPSLEQSIGLTSAHMFFDNQTFLEEHEDGSITIYFQLSRDTTGSDVDSFDPEVLYSIDFSKDGRASEVRSGEAVFPDATSLEIFVTQINVILKWADKPEQIVWAGFSSDAPGTLVIVSKERYRFNQDAYSVYIKKGEGEGIAMSATIEKIQNNFTIGVTSIAVSFYEDNGVFHILSGQDFRFGVSQLDGGRMLSVLTDMPDSAVRTNKAMLFTLSILVGELGVMGAKQKTFGGINFNANLLKLDIQRDDNGFPLPIDPKLIEEFKGVQGFLPVITNIVPLSSLPELSKHFPAEEEFKLAYALEQAIRID